MMNSSTEYPEVSQEEKLLQLYEKQVEDDTSFSLSFSFVLYMSLLSITGLTGNLMLILYKSDVKKRTMSDHLLYQHSINDLLICIFVIPLCVGLRFTEILTSAPCFIMKLLCNTFVGVSVFLHFSFAIITHIDIYRHKALNIRTIHVMLIMAAIWFISLGISIGPATLASPILLYDTQISNISGVSVIPKHCLIDTRFQISTESPRFTLAIINSIIMAVIFSLILILNGVSLKRLQKFMSTQSGRAEGRFRKNGVVHNREENEDRKIGEYEESIPSFKKKQSVLNDIGRTGHLDVEYTTEKTISHKTVSTYHQSGKICRARPCAQTGTTVREIHVSKASSSYITDNTNKNGRIYKADSSNEDSHTESEKHDTNYKFLGLRQTMKSELYHENKCDVMQDNSAKGSKQYQAEGIDFVKQLKKSYSAPLPFSQSRLRLKSAIENLILINRSINATYRRDIQRQRNTVSEFNIESLSEEDVPSISDSEQSHANNEVFHNPPNKYTDNVLSQEYKILENSKTKQFHSNESSENQRARRSTWNSTQEPKNRSKARISKKSINLQNLTKAVREETMIQTSSKKKEMDKKNWLQKFDTRGTIVSDMIGNFSGMTSRYSSTSVFKVSSQKKCSKNIAMNILQSSQILAFGYILVWTPYILTELAVIPINPILHNLFFIANVLHPIILVLIDKQFFQTIKNMFINHHFKEKTTSEDEYPASNLHIALDNSQT